MFLKNNVKETILTILNSQLGVKALFLLEETHSRINVMTHVFKTLPMQDRFKIQFHLKLLETNAYFLLTH